MKRYTKNPAVSQVFIPGHGRIQEGQILMGDNLAKYAPQFLVEVPDSPARAPLESTQPVRAPALITEPAPVPEAPPPREEMLREELPGSEDVLTEEKSSEMKRPRGRPRKNG